MIDESTIVALYVRTVWTIPCRPAVQWFHCGFIYGKHLHKITTYKYCNILYYFLHLQKIFVFKMIQRENFYVLGKLYPENASDEDTCKRTIEIPQRTRIIKASFCLKVHNVPLK